MGLRSWSAAQEPQNHLATAVKSRDSRSHSKHTESVLREVGPGVCIFEDVILRFVCYVQKPDVPFMQRCVICINIPCISSQLKNCVN